MAKPKDMDELRIYKQLLEEYKVDKGAISEIKRAARDESDKTSWQEIKKQMEQLW